MIIRLAQIILLAVLVGPSSFPAIAQSGEFGKAFTSHCVATFEAAASRQQGAKNPKPTEFPTLSAIIKARTAEFCACLGGALEGNREISGYTKSSMLERTKKESEYDRKSRSVEDNGRQSCRRFEADNNIYLKLVHLCLVSVCQGQKAREIEMHCRKIDGGGSMPHRRYWWN